MELEFKLRSHLWAESKGLKDKSGDLGKKWSEERAELSRKAGHEEFESIFLKLEFLRERNVYIEYMPFLVRFHKIIDHFPSEQIHFQSESKDEPMMELPM